jgi:uncharacterized Zn finger protein
MNKKTRTTGRSCAGKQKHSSRGQAEDHIFRLVRTLGAQRSAYAVYRCGKCGTFHIGHVGRKKL